MKIANREAQFLRRTREAQLFGKVGLLRFLKSWAS